MLSQCVRTPFTEESLDVCTYCGDSGVYHFYGEPQNCLCNPEPEKTVFGLQKQIIHLCIHNACWECALATDESYKAELLASKDEAFRIVYEQFKASKGALNRYFKNAEKGTHKDQDNE